MDKLLHVVTLKMFDLRVTFGDVLVKFDTMSNNLVNDMVSGIDLNKTVDWPVTTFCGKKYIRYK